MYLKFIFPLAFTSELFYFIIESLARVVKVDFFAQNFINNFLLLVVNSQTYKFTNTSGIFLRIKPNHCDQVCKINNIYFCS